MSWERFRRVLPCTAEVNDAGHLEIGGRDTADLAREFGTPLLVGDLADLRDRLGRYREAFGGDNVHYAGKAFLTRTLARLLVDEGTRLDCASGGELYTALSGGFPADRIVVHGNNKSLREIEEAVDAGVGRIVLDSRWDLERLQGVAASRRTVVPALLRINPGVEVHTHEYLKTGIADSKFGVPIGPRALDVIAAAADASNVELVGLHCHIGSQALEVEPFGDAARIMVRFLAEARAASRLALPELDLGGGLGIAYVPEDQAPTIEALGKVVTEAVISEAEAAGTPVPTVQVEAGRSVVGPAMVTLYRAGAIKEIPGHRPYVAVDGGMSDNIRPSLYQAVYTFLSATRPRAAHDRTFAVAGKLCESGDVLRRDAMLPDLEPGELLCVAATGAYVYAMASNYNRIPRPAVIAVADGEVTVLARRETYEDLVRLEPDPR